MGGILALILYGAIVAVVVWFAYLRGYRRAERDQEPHFKSLHREIAMLDRRVMFHREDGARWMKEAQNWQSRYQALGNRFADIAALHPQPPVFIKSDDPDPKIIAKPGPFKVVQKDLSSLIAAPDGTALHVITPEEAAQLCQQENPHAKG